jgi:hypothetical protein
MTRLTETLSFAHQALYKSHAFAGLFTTPIAAYCCCFYCQLPRNCATIHSQQSTLAPFSYIKAARFLFFQKQTHKVREVRYLEPCRDCHPSRRRCDSCRPRCLQMKITKGLTWPFLLFTFAAL